ncbi:hypothetical protein [Vreelandella titanicae]|uniref:hypothetical protein n=1 Tax=Vreelandella titanicae TaxID=664683 RepID=UPI003825BF52
MKPIEPGCMCLIVNSEYAGTSVTAVRRVTPKEIIHGYRADCHGWLVDKGDLFGVFVDAQLRRIDDYDESADATEQAREVEHAQ